MGGAPSRFGWICHGCGNPKDESVGRAGTPDAGSGFCTCPLILRGVRLKGGRIVGKWKYNFTRNMEACLETLNQEAQTAEICPSSGERRIGSGLRLICLETIVLAVVLFVGINAISARVRVDGFSMRPTLEDGEFVLVNKLSYFFGDEIAAILLFFISR
jgi:hypothetical protein